MWFAIVEVFSAALVGGMLAFAVINLAISLRGAADFIERRRNKED
jgi:hypothetical protein